METSCRSMKKLSSGTVRLIASTQVITSVFSVVKELVENSLDAGAKSIEIKLENYGFNRIEVRDNGCGIDKEDVELMALPHYTSKIASTDDLQQLLTYGFRGEALGALCAVGDVTITTKTVKDVAGMQYSVNKKGEIFDRKLSHLSTGTTVTALNLFKCLPVRKQYYSTSTKCREELKRVEDLVTAFSIIRHDVRFWLRHNKDMIFQSTAVNSSRDVLLKVIGTTAMCFMERRVRDWLDPEMRIEMYLPKKSSKWQLMSRKNKDKFYFFVNKRPVEMKTLEKEIKAYYNRVFGSENRWPLGFISLQLPPEDIDVNLEPNKNRVLLQSEGEVMCRLMVMLGEIYGPLDTTASVSKTEDNADDSLESDNSNTSDSSLLGCGLPHFSRPNKGLFTQAEVSDEHSHIENPLNSNASSAKSVVRTKHISISIDTNNAMDIDENDHSIVSKRMGSDLSAMEESLVKSGPSERILSLPPTQNISNFKITDDDFISSTPISADFGLVSGDIIEASRTVDNFITSQDELNSPTEQICYKSIAQIARSVVSEQKLVSADVRDDATIETISIDPAGFVEEDQGNSKNWSKGNCLTDKEGTNVQPFILLTSSSTCQKLVHDVSENVSDLSTSTSASFARNSVCLNSISSLLVNTTPSARKKVPSAVTPDQLSLFEVMGSAIIKPTTTFISFSKEVRPRVIKENPGATIHDIAQIIGEKWNRLSPNEKAKYENMMSTDNSREEKRKLSDSLKSDTGSVKKQKVDKVYTGTLSVATKKLVKEEKRAYSYEVKTDFSLVKLKQLYKTGGNLSKLRWGSPKFRPLGQLKTAPIWLGIQKEQIIAFCPVRAQETLIYETLLTNHTLSADTLKDPIHILPSMFGPKLWLTLLGLSKSDAPRTDLYVYYDDPRLLKNGFSIRQYEKCQDLCVEVVGMFKGMNLYGISDLQEVLQAISDIPLCQLQQCRSSKIRQYLQGEAVRMARQLPQRLSFEETEGVLEEIYKKLPVTTLCFHQKPFLKSLYDLQNLE